MRDVRVGLHGVIFVLIMFLVVSGAALVWTTLEISSSPNKEETRERQWQEKVLESWELIKLTALNAESIALSSAQKAWKKIKEVTGPFLKTSESGSSSLESPIRVPVVEEGSPIESDTQEAIKVTRTRKQKEKEEEEYSETLRYRTGIEVPLKKLRTSDPFADEISEESNEQTGPPTSALRADLDGDGDEDALAIGHEGTIVWYQNNGGPESLWLQRVIDPAIDAAILIAIADIDADGDKDIVSVSVSRDQISWYDNSGDHTPSWTRRFIASGGRTTNAMEVKDLDNDGDLDVRVIPTRDDIMWYLNDGKKPPGWDPLPE